MLAIILAGLLASDDAWHEAARCAAAEANLELCRPEAEVTEQDADALCERRLREWRESGCDEAAKEK